MFLPALAALQVPLFASDGDLSRESKSINYSPAAGAYSPAAGAYSPAAGANVVMITIDTLRADHLGCYGYRNILTPNIDAIAAEGWRFEQAYTAVPITLPSHASIMTGSYPMKTGLHDFSGNRLNPRQPTMAGILRQQGYSTGAVVGSAVLDSRFGLNSGFDFYYDHFDFNRLTEANLDLMERPANQVVDQALAWLDTNSKKKFFLWVHLYDPHFPYAPPPPYAKEYKDHPYDGEIAFADSQVGRLLVYLKRANLYNSALIVVVGDHGEGLGEHKEKTHGFFIYDSTLHVPLLLKLPQPDGSPAQESRLDSKGLKKKIGRQADSSRRRQGSSVKTPVSLVDLLPTVLEILNVSIPAQVQGKSLSPLMRAVEEKGSELYAETYLPRIHFNWSELRGLRNGRYHFIDAPKAELFDLEADPRELTNLYTLKPALASELRGRLAGVIQQRTPGGELAEKTTLDPAMLERLKSLGYIAVSSGASFTLSDPHLPDPKERIETYELISSAIADSQHGRFDSSIQKLESALKTEKDSIPVHYLLALDFYRKNDFAAATREFQRVLQLSSGYALAAYYLGLTQGAAGDWEAASSSLQHALQLDKTNFSAAFNLGAAYLKLQRVEEASAAFRQSVEINPRYAPGYRALGEVLVYQGKGSEAVKALQRAVELNPEDPTLHIDLAKAYEVTGMSAQAAQERGRAEALRLATKR